MLGNLTNCHLLWIGIEQLVLLEKANGMYDSVRARQAAETIRDLAAEGLRFDQKDMLMLEAYIRGTLSSIDMLTHALQFATADEYHDWLREPQKIQANVTRTRVSVDQMLREFQNQVKRRHVRAESEF